MLPIEYKLVKPFLLKFIFHLIIHMVLTLYKLLYCVFKHLNCYREKGGIYIKINWKVQWQLLSNEMKAPISYKIMKYSRI